MREILGLSQEEFNKGFEEFVEAKELCKVKKNIFDSTDGNPLDKTIIMLYGKSCLGEYYREYLNHLIESKVSK